MPRREHEERLLELKAVIDALTQVMRAEPARLWLRSPVPALGYEKPIDLIEGGQYRRVIGAILALAEASRPDALGSSADRDRAALRAVHGRV